MRSWARNSSAAAASPMRSTSPVESTRSVSSRVRTWGALAGCIFIASVLPFDAVAAQPLGPVQRGVGLRVPAFPVVGAVDRAGADAQGGHLRRPAVHALEDARAVHDVAGDAGRGLAPLALQRSEEHTSELQSR